jgi:hypothetical protein
MNDKDTASPLVEFKDFDEIRIEDLDSPDFAQTPCEDRLRLEFERLMQQCRGIKYDAFHVPNLSRLIHRQIAQHGYSHRIIGDLHFIIPPSKLR